MMASANTERQTLLSLTNSTRTVSGLLPSLSCSPAQGVDRNTGDTTLLLTSNFPWSGAAPSCKQQQDATWQLADEPCMWGPCQ